VVHTHAARSWAARRQAPDPDGAFALLAVATALADDATEVVAAVGRGAEVGVLARPTAALDGLVAVVVGALGWP